MKNKLMIIVLAFLMIACKPELKKVVYYESVNGKIFTLAAYENIKIKMLERGEIKENFLSTEERNDSTLISFDTYVKSDRVNPYKHIDKWLGKELPLEKLKNINGNEFTLESLNGKPTLVNFWFVNCLPCIEEMPQLNRLKENYGDRVNFLAVTFNTKSKVDDFLLRTTFNFTHVVDAKFEMDKLDNKSYPLNIYLDRNGIIKSYQGFLSEELNVGMNKELEKLLEPTKV